MTQEEKWLLAEKYNDEKCEAFFADLELLKSGTPLAYLIGSIPFLDCTIYLDSHPLIPRPETEFWTEKAITQVRGATPYFSEKGMSSLAVLDLCAGSGAIGVAVAKAIPEVQVDFAEIDSAHLSTIQKNLLKNIAPPSSSELELAKKYRVIAANLFCSSSELELDTYDFILTNPPYIDPEIDRAEESVKLHEPHLALYGGIGGMECIASIIEQAPAHLTTNGQLWIEHEPEQSNAIKKLANERNFSCTTHTDQYSVDRYSVLVLQ